MCNGTIGKCTHYKLSHKVVAIWRFHSLTKYSHSFCSHAKGKVQHITEEHKKMNDAYREVCIMFNESSKTTEPAEFFSQFTQFINEWKASYTTFTDSNTSQ